jgi:tRNA(Arg) A34 adenosine deaminase TadA
MSDEELMRRAIALSLEHSRAGDCGPFGAVIARAGRIVAEGWNRVVASADPTAHAEITAIREACRALRTHELRGCVIYTSCEPCPMCLAAIFWARLDAVVYANTREDAAAIGFDDAFLYDQVALPPGARALPFTRLLGEEARVAFEAWTRNPAKVAY